MDDKLLIIEEMKQKYPDQWLLVTDCKLSENTELRAGRVVEYSRCRDDIHKALKNYTGEIAIYYMGEIPDDLTVMFLAGCVPCQRGCQGNVLQSHCGY